MVLVRGTWRTVLLYGTISVLLFCIFQFGWFGIVTKGHTQSAKAAEANRQAVLRDERITSRFNTCVKAAEHNAKKIRVCQRERFGYVPHP